ncbi:MAG: CAP domain-containing protein [Burkholderiales bacterium]
MKKLSPTSFAPIFVTLFALALSACGGGGSDSPAAGTVPAPAAPVATSGSTCGISDFANAALARMNALRAAGADCRTAGKFAPAASLTWSAQLTQSSEAHTQDMVTHNFFSHTGSNGSTLSVRVDATGYQWNALGENIAAGQSGLDVVMTAWMGSDGHCANLMNPAFKDVGLVCVPGTATTTYNIYWTMDLGASR